MTQHKFPKKKTYKGPNKYIQLVRVHNCRVDLQKHFQKHRGGKIYTLGFKSEQGYHHNAKI